MKRLAAAALAASLVTPPVSTAHGQQPETAEEQPQPKYCKRLLLDLKGLAVRPAHFEGKDWGKVGLALLAIGGTMALDEPIRDEIQRHRNPGADDAAETLRPLGHRIGPALLLGGLWVAGELAHRPELTAIGKDGVEASLFTQVLIVPVLKKAVGRARPDEELGAFELDPFSEFQSFPSGEATQAFTIAAVIAEHSGNGWVEGTAWGLAGLIGLERLYLDRHWASDVVAGALIGTAVGRWVARRNGAGKPIAWIVVPAVSHDGLAVFGTLSF